MDEENKIQRFEPGARALEARPARPLVTPYETIQVEETPDLLAYWRVIRKRRWTILTIFLVLFTLVLIGTLKMTPIYQAKVLLEIQKENPNILSVQELFELETVSDTYLETQYKILKSDSLARRVIDELGMEKIEEFNPPRRWWSSDRAEGGPKSNPGAQVFAVEGSLAEREPMAYQRVLKRFQKKLAVEPIRRSRLVEVSFESEDPALAARAVNSLAGMYIEQNLEARWEATQKATDWLSQQLLGLKAGLEKSEDEMQKYARENGLLFLVGEKGAAENIMNERLRQMQEELSKAEGARFEKEGLYRLVEGGDYGSLPGVFENKLMQDLTIRLAELRREHAELSSTFTPDYPKVKQVQNQLDEIEAVLARERQRAAQRIVNDYRAATARENLLRQAFAVAETQANVVAEKSVQYNILKREVDTNKQLYEGLLQRMKEAGVSAGLKASNIRIVDPAEPPERPARPVLLLNLGLAVVMGLGLGVGTAFLLEYLDNTLKTSESVERYLHVPTLALIPSVESMNGKRGVYGLFGRAKLLAAGDKHPKERALIAQRDQVKNWFRIDAADKQHSVLAEAFRSLRTSILLSTAGHPPRSLLVASAQPGEGKTTVSLNLAITLAQLGGRVLLIDCDMRRPCIHRALQIKDSTGLVGYLTGHNRWQDAVRPTTVGTLSALVCGPIPPNPAELLSSDRMRELLNEAIRDYEFVVLDSPPLLNVADGRILATLVDGAVLTIKGGETARDLARRAQDQIRDVGGTLIGVVLNNLDVRADDYYYYRYDYYGKSREEA